MAEQILLITFLLILSGSFSGSETALFSLTRSEVAAFKRSGTVLAKSVLDALSHPRRLLLSILIGNELVNVAISILIAGLVYDMVPDMLWQLKVLLAVVVSTPLVVVIGEVIPKNVGIRFASFFAVPCAIYIKWFSWLMSPIRRMLLKLADKFIILFGGKPNDVRSMIMEEEFRQMVELGCSEGNLEEAEGELIHSLLDMADKKAEEVMTPREALLAVSLNEDIDSAISLVRTSRFARIPVYDSDPDDIVGILHVRELFSVLRKRRIKKIRDVEDIIRSAYFISAEETLEQVLKDFQKLKMHMGIVVDKAKRPIGVLTMEDVFSTLFES